jgi:hypothetical protein
MRTVALGCGKYLARTDGSYRFSGMELAGVLAFCGKFIERGTDAG